MMHTILCLLDVLYTAAEGGANLTSSLLFSVKSFEHIRDVNVIFIYLPPPTLSVSHKAVPAEVVLLSL